jgi:hypothetical protein
MRGLRKLPIAIGLALSLGSGPAAAGDTDDFHAAVAGAYGHYREAYHYLETGNADLGAVALDAFVAAWKKLAERYAGKPPPAYAQDADFAEALAAIAGKAESAVNAAPGEALLALRPIRGDLAALRRRSGQRLFSDCVDDMKAAQNARYFPSRRRRALNFGQPRAVAAFKAAAAHAETWYRRCRDEAPAAVGASPEFRRLFEGAFARFARLEALVDARDEQQIYNALGELRSFDKLIWLRFG